MQLHHFECDTVCGFMTQGYDKDEIAEIAMEHAKTKHNKVDITEEMIRGMITAKDAESN